ncbi:MAG: hypothetical protein LUI60_05250 [Clostridia bacterium]|nr:hypothetical protein [Clostridia bacterium]
MNKKLRILFCMLLSIIAICALAIVGCSDDDTEISSSSVSSSTTSDTSSDSTSSGDSTHTHTYSTNPDDIEWTWTEDTTNGGYIVKASLPCTDSTCDNSLEVTATVTCEVTTPATCTTTGLANYTAKATINGTEYTATKTGVTLAKNTTNHSAELTKVDAVASTDDTDGNIEYYYCSACGNYCSDSEGKTLITAADTVITHKASVVPTALNIGGATEATLNSTNSSYDREYEVTTSGYYTIVLACDDLASLELSGLGVSVYNGTTLVGSLTDAENYTIVTDYAVGETLDVYAVLNGAKLYPVTFTVTITYVAGEVERTVTGYAESDPIQLYYGTGWEYTADMDVESGDTLWYKINGRGGGIDLLLSVTSDDTTFTVYGYDTNSATTEYAALTTNEDGYYAFSLSYANHIEYIKIVNNGSDGTITVTLTEDIDYSITEDGGEWDITDTAMGNNGTAYIFPVTDAGKYLITVDDDANIGISSETAGSAFTTEVFFSSDSDNGDVLYYVATLLANEELTVTAYAHVTSTITITPIADQITESPATLSDEGTYIFITDTAGGYYYTFSVANNDEDSDLYVEYGLTSLNVWKNNTTETVGLTAGTIVYITANSNNSVIYITKGEEYEEITYSTSVPTTLTAGTYTISLDAYDAWNYKTVEYSFAAGEYKITLTGSDAYLSIYSSDYYTVSSGWFTTEYSFEISETTTIYFIYTTYSGAAGSYTLTLTASTAASGTNYSVNADTVATDISSLVTSSKLTSDATIYTGEDGTTVTLLEGVGYDTLTTEGETYSYGDVSTTSRVKLNGAGTTSKQSIKVTLVAGAAITVYAKSGSSDSRILMLLDSEGNIVSAGVATNSYGAVVLTATASGTYYIAGSNGINIIYLAIDYSADLTNSSTVSAVTISGDTTVTVDGTTTLTAAVTTTDGSEYTGDIVWSSSNAKYATVSNGAVTGQSDGSGKTVTIYAYADGIVATYSVTVQAAS